MSEIESLRAYRPLEGIDWKTVDGHINQVFGEGVMNPNDKFIGRRELILLDEYELAEAHQLRGVLEGTEGDTLADTVRADMPDSFSRPTESKGLRDPKIVYVPLPNGQKKKMLAAPIKSAGQFRTERDIATKSIENATGKRLGLRNRSLGVWLAGVTTASYLDDEKLKSLGGRLHADVRDIYVAAGDIEPVTLELR
jgi:hypothetical protein